jgi:hypothetical protein
MNIERKTAFKEAKGIRTCHTGLMPLIGVNMGDIPHLAPNLDDDEDDNEP